MLYLVLLAAFGVLGTFIVPTVLRRSQRGIRERDAVVSAGLVMPRVIQNSSIAYAIGLMTLAPLLAWGINGQFWSAIVYIAFVGLGLSLIYVLRRRMLHFLGDALVHDRSITVHEFISLSHGNDPRVRVVAAALTVFAVCGLIVCQMLATAIVLKPLLSGSAGLTELFIAAIFLVVAMCTLSSGHTGIMHATQIQLGLLYFGLFGSTACLLYLQVSELGAMPLRGVAALALIVVICTVIHLRRRARYVDTSLARSGEPITITGLRGLEPVGLRFLRRSQKILNSLVGVFAVTLIVLAAVVAALELYIAGASTVVRDGLAAVRAGNSVSKATLISLILLAVFHPIVDIVNWQRLAAFARSRDSNYFKEGQWTAAFKSFCAAYAVEVPLMGLFICLLGVLAGLSLGTPPEGDAIRAFFVRLLAQENSVATATLAFLLFSFFALAVSTMGSLFSSGLCTFRYDIVTMLWPEPRAALRQAAETRMRRLTLVAGLAIGLTTLAAFHFVDEVSQITFAGAAFLGLLFSFSSAQLSFAPLVLGPLIVGADGFGTLTPGWALAVLIVSSAIGIGTVTVGLVTGYESSLPWAVPGCLGSALLLFVVASLLRQWTSVAPKM